MAFSTGRPTEANAVEVKLQGSFMKTQSIRVYESAFSVNTSQVLFYADSLLINRYIDGKATRTYPRIATQIIDPADLIHKQSSDGFDQYKEVASYSGLIPYHRYLVFCNGIEDVKLITGHYGNLYVGGVEINYNNVRASSNTDYAYEIEMTVLDLPLFLDYSKLNYKITEPLTFDVGDYVDNRRYAYNVINMTNTFAKLSLATRLTRNELQIECRDNVGKRASEHIMNMYGISDTTMLCSARIDLTAISDDDTVVQQKSFIVANVGYTDDPIDVTLPWINENVVALQILITYTIELRTLSTDITVATEHRVTDQQLASLRQVSVADLS